MSQQSPHLRAAHVPLTGLLLGNTSAHKEATKKRASGHRDCWEQHVGSFGNIGSNWSISSRASASISD
jgi:hypothetical protein